jgi:hypothetical protein
VARNSTMWPQLMARDSSGRRRRRLLFRRLVIRALDQFPIGWRMVVRSPSQMVGLVRIRADWPIHRQFLNRLIHRSRCRIPGPAGNAPPSALPGLMPGSSRYRRVYCHPLWEGRGYSAGIGTNSRRCTLRNWDNPYLLIFPLPASSRRQFRVVLRTVLVIGFVFLLR